MKVALLSLALIGQPVTIPVKVPVLNVSDKVPVLNVSDKVPVLNVEKLCKETEEDDKANGLADAQHFSTCMEDEKNARQQLSTMWATSPSAVRDQCEVTATAVGQSYVDLLTCLQASAIAANPSLRGASKNRNKQ